MVHGYPACIAIVIGQTECLSRKRCLFPTPALGQVSHNWTREEVRALFGLPFPELIPRVHRQHFDPTAVQISALLSIKTGDCPPQRLRRIANARS